MLAYVFYHWKRSDVAAVDYEQRLRDFHDALRLAPSAGFRSSWCASLTGAPWANNSGDSYEDWYLINGSIDLEPLNDAAISASRQVPHDQAAASAAGGTAGLYRLKAGAAIVAPLFASWFSKPNGWSYGQLLERLQPVTDYAALWGRQMTLGPALEFCLHANALPQIPAGINALSIPLRSVFPECA